MMQKVSRQSCITLTFSLKGSTLVLMIQVSCAVSVPTVTFTTFQTLSQIWGFASRALFVAPPIGLQKSSTQVQYF